MSLTDSYNAFAPMVTAFAAGQSPALEVAYPGIHFDPPDNALWMEILAPVHNKTHGYSLEDDGAKVKTGFYRVLVSYPPGINYMDALQVAEQLANEFPKGTVFDGARMDKPPTVGTMAQSGGIAVIPVTLYWRL